MMTIPLFLHHRSWILQKHHFVNQGCVAIGPSQPCADHLPGRKKGQAVGPGIFGSFVVFPIPPMGGGVRRWNHGLGFGYMT